MIEENRRISKQELMIIFSVTRGTIENWHKNYGLPLIVVSSHSKYIKLNDLIEWEKSMIKNSNLIKELSD